MAVPIFSALRQAGSTLGVFDFASRMKSAAVVLIPFMSVVDTVTGGGGAFEPSTPVAQLTEESSDHVEITPPNYVETAEAVVLAPDGPSRTGSDLVAGNSFNSFENIPQVKIVGPLKGYFLDQQTGSPLHPLGIEIACTQPGVTYNVSFTETETGSTKHLNGPVPCRDDVSTLAWDHRHGLQLDTAYEVRLQIFGPTETGRELLDETVWNDRPNFHLAFWDDASGASAVTATRFFELDTSGSMTFSIAPRSGADDGGCLGEERFANPHLAIAEGDSVLIDGKNKIIVCLTKGHEYSIGFHELVHAIENSFFNFSTDRAFNRHLGEFDAGGPMAEELLADCVQQIVATSLGELHELGETVQYYFQSKSNNLSFKDCEQPAVAELAPIMISLACTNALDKFLQDACDQLAANGTFSRDEVAAYFDDPEIVALIIQEALRPFMAPYGGDYRNAPSFLPLVYVGNTLVDSPALTYGQWQGLMDAGTARNVRLADISPTLARPRYPAGFESPGEKLGVQPN